MKDYAKANESWNKALELPDISASDVALIHNNKAACHMVKKQYKEAVNECSTALQAQPEYVKALVRRAKAYENLGKYKDALADIQKASSLGYEDANTVEQRVKNLMAGKKPAGMGSGLSGRRASTARAAAASNRQITIPVKLSMGNDTRAFQLAPGITYSELMEHVRQLFPNAGHFVLKHLDNEGDLITIASRADINRAIQQSIESSTQVPGRQQSFPPIRLHAVKVSSADEVPKAPEEESKYMQQMLEQLQKIQQGKKTEQRQVSHEQPVQQIQVDEWILAFVDLLKEHCNLDPDRPIEAQEVGNEKLSAAFQSMMLSDPKTDKLLDDAYDKFREQTALGMVLQAQVDDARATNIMQKAAIDGTPVAEIAPTVEGLLKRALEKIDESIAYCPSVIDAYVMKGQIEQGWAKLAAHYLVEPVKYVFACCYITDLRAVVACPDPTMYCGVLQAS